MSEKRHASEALDAGAPKREKLAVSAPNEQSLQEGVVDPNAPAEDAVEQEDAVEKEDSEAGSATEVQSFEERIEQLESEKLDAMGELEFFRYHVGVYEGRMKDLIRELQQKNVDLTNRANGLQLQLARALADSHQLRQTLTNNNSQNNQLSANLQSANQRLTTLESQNAQLNQTVGSLRGESSANYWQAMAQTQLQTVNADRDRLKNELTTLKNARRELTGELEEAVKERDGFETELEQAKSELADLKAKLDRLTAQIGEAKAAIDKCKAILGENPEVAPM
jgi:chromosome segregation ATPase